MIIFAEAKQLIRIISKVKFIMENNLGLFWKWRIFELAIIISAAIRILRMIKVEDIVSIAEDEVIEYLIWLSWVKLIKEINVSKNKDDMVIHQ